MKILKYTLSLYFCSVMLFSCDPEVEDLCRPDRVTVTTNMGSTATTVIKDFKYEDDHLARVIWSTNRTDDYQYNDDGTLSVLSSDFQLQYEVHRNEYLYDNGLLIRIDEYVIPLDGFTGLGTDTILNGYHTYSYDGDYVESVEVYSKDSGSGSIVLFRVISYTYDETGNIVTYTMCNASETDTIEACTFEYDIYRNPYYAVYPAFTGESYINNIVKKTDLVSGIEYVYNKMPDNRDYPEQINIMAGVYLSEVIRITYNCD